MAVHLLQTTMYTFIVPSFTSYNTTHIKTHPPLYQINKTTDWWFVFYLECLYINNISYLLWIQTWTLELVYNCESVLPYAIIYYIEGWFIITHKLVFLHAEKFITVTVSISEDWNHFVSIYCFSYISCLFK